LTSKHSLSLPKTLYVSNQQKDDMVSLHFKGRGRPKKPGVRGTRGLARVATPLSDKPEQLFGPNSPHPQGRDEEETQ